MPYRLYSHRPAVPANQKLWAALVRRDAEGLRVALAHGADPDVVWKGHTCALTHAVLTRNEEAALILIDEGARVWQPGYADRGRIPIEEAACLGQYTVVRRMLRARDGERLPEMTRGQWWCLLRRARWNNMPLVDDLFQAVPEALMAPGSPDERARRWADIANAPKEREGFFQRLAQLPFMGFPERSQCSPAAWNSLVAAAHQGHAWVEAQVQRSMEPEDLFASHPYGDDASKLLPRILAQNVYFFPHDRARNALAWLADSKQGARLLTQNRDELLAAGAAAGSLKRLTGLLDALGMQSGAIAEVRHEGQTLLHHAASERSEPRQRALLMAWLVARGVDPNARDREGRTALELQCAMVEVREALIRALLEAGCRWTDTARASLRQRHSELEAAFAAEELEREVPDAGCIPPTGARLRF